MFESLFLILIILAEGRSSPVASSGDGVISNAPTQKNGCWNGVQNFARMCYYTDWSAYRKGKGHYEPKDINYDLCTHIIYAFAVLKDDTADDIIPGDEYLDIEKDFYGQVNKLKKNNVPVILSIGGRVDSTTKYATMLASPELRARLASNIAQLLLRHGFDGLDVAFGFPGIYQLNSEKVQPDDIKKNFLLLLQNLRDEFDAAALSAKLKNKLTLSVAVSGNARTINMSYDVVGMSKICDWFGVMTYDMHTKDEPYTGINAPFSVQPGDTEDDRPHNLQNMMNEWLIRGAPANKLVVGIPFYGRSFLLVDETKNGLHAPAEGMPNRGEYTGAAAYMAFYEIVDKVKDEGWSVVHNNYLGSYAYKGTQWVGYDDKFDVAVKAAYTQINCFYGVAVWTIEYDCFQEDCSAGTHPLLSTIKAVLTGKVLHTDVENCT